MHVTIIKKKNYTQIILDLFPNAKTFPSQKKMQKHLIYL